MMTDAPAELARTLAIDIRAIARALKARVREEGGGGDLTASQISVLVRLEKHGPATVSSLARIEGMRPQSMREVVAPLQEAGLVSGTPDPDDGRQTLMALTPRCLKWIREGRAASQDWLTQTIARRLSIREQQKLGEALALLRRLVE